MPEILSPVLTVGMVSEAVPAEPSTAGAALPRALAKLPSKAVQVFLADIAGLDASPQVLSLSLPKLRDLIRLRWRGL